MASIYKSPNENGTITYFGSVYIDGKRFRRRLANSRASALKELKKWEYELLIQRQNKAIKQRKQINHTRLSFLKEIELSGISDKSLQTIKYSTRFFMEYCHSFNIEHINDVVPEIAKNYISKRASKRINNTYKSNTDGFSKRISPATLNKEIQYLKRYFEYCVDMEWINKNPFRKVKYFKVQRKQRYYFTESDIKKILDNAGKFYDFYYFLLHTGLRATDTFRLKPSHIIDNYLKIKMNKTGDFLNIPLSEHILSVLSPRMHNLRLFMEVLSDRQRKNSTKLVQSHFSPSFVRENNINLHTFRHTYAHSMLNKGVPKEVLQTLLGHRSIKTTEIYANWMNKNELEKYV
tara:strand:- start:428 stop:1471 length:1044 start_codon:yes stop_codon:yes gene_type:complete